MFDLRPEDPTWRLRSLHRAMPFDEFERTIPIRAGWKREYYGGKAHVRPSWTCVTFEYDLRQADSRPADTEPAGVLRGVMSDDRPALREAFLDAFRVAPEYCDYADDGYTAEAEKYLDGFYGDTRGQRSPASRLIAVGNEVVAAALVKCGTRTPVLDCLLVRPAFSRRGLATRVTRAACAALAAEGELAVRSWARLANEASVRWHRRFGFVELPDWITAQSRYFAAANELQRLQEHDGLSPLEDAERMAEIEQLRREYARVEELKKADLDSVFPLDD